ncbi:MAG TPA: hypothetical protein VFA71_06080 [Terriglobales bacterium]|nr:hypothetical protein [Terriglobales bacterium]
MKKLFPIVGLALVLVACAAMKTASTHNDPTVSAYLEQVPDSNQQQIVAIFPTTTSITFNGIGMWAQKGGCSFGVAVRDRDANTNSQVINSGSSTSPFGNSGSITPFTVEAGHTVEIRVLPTQGCGQAGGVNIIATYQ